MWPVTAGRASKQGRAGGRNRVEGNGNL